MNLKKIGMLVPSSNTALEPLTAEIMKGISGVSIHYARFTVTEVKLNEEAYNQFSLEPMLVAAKMLADAKVDVIVYNGTSGGWIGFDHDKELCEAIYATTGIQATTSVLALNALLDTLKPKQISLVSPCEMDVAMLISSNYKLAGYPCEHVVAYGETDNYACALVGDNEVKELIRKAKEPLTDVIITFGTNLWSAHLVEEMEKELDVLIIDTVTVTLWYCLYLIEHTQLHFQNWGKCFEKVYTSNSV